LPHGEEAVRDVGRLHVLGADLWQDGRVKATATAKLLEAK
jgi:hypothetical protein